MSNYRSKKSLAVKCFTFSETASKYQQCALALEAKGAWRRAARQWLAFFDCVDNDYEREYAALQREKCLTRAEALTRQAEKQANSSDSQ
ncbi:PerC family transcriptional regulator [Salmonella enterica]|uniref:PerC family transcriptional regulator n=1 Tax=Salmonella montevideo TaxID=115981 RepID=A0A741Q157_SALMO|nr:PerC family transcriptional regulator [Salmonella enterica]EKI4966785.1 PerC family transcriptional regulator [Salmonella enterica]HAF0924255.1 PerC family transcriptional regulator [Salmonella enterica subsp. enterica serovar Montevideo]